MNASLQNSLQSAAAKASRYSTVADLVTKHVGSDVARYLHASDLYHVPHIGALVKNPNDMSIVLADAYRYGWVGRIHAPRGREKFAYGAPGPKAAGIQIAGRKQGVIKSPEKKVVGYRLLRQFEDAESAWDFMADTPEARIAGHWAVVIEFGSAEEALRHIVPLLGRGCEIEEVKE